MTREEKVNYLRIALALQTIPCDDRTADQIIETIDTIEKKKGKFSIHDAVQIDYRISEKYKRIEIKVVPEEKKDE